MKKIQNQSFVGLQNLEALPNALDVKHGATVSTFKMPKTVKQLAKKEKYKFIGLDIETDIKTGNIMLLGLTMTNETTKKNSYAHFYRNDQGLEKMLEFFAIVMDNTKNYAFTYWGKFDCINLFRLFLEYNNTEEEDIRKACLKYSKSVGGSYHKDLGWSTEPIVKCFINYKKAEVGVLNVINDCIQLYFITEQMKKNGSRPITIWCYDASKFYNDGLEKTAERELKLWDYKKFTEKEHIVNWGEFEQNYQYEEPLRKQEGYTKAVLTSNQHDTRATKELMEKAQELFIDTFKVNPSILLSVGSLADIVLSKLHEDNFEDLASLNWVFQLQDFDETGHTQEELSHLFNIAIDSYSAGQIDILQLGYTEKLAFADINSAYPSIMRSLLDLRGATIKRGSKCRFSEVPKPNGTNYIFLTASVRADKKDIHTLTIKSPAFLEELNKSSIWEEQDEIIFSNDKNTADQNMRPRGKFIVSGLYEEFLFLQNQQKERGQEKDFRVLEWVEIQTTGKENPLKKVIETLYSLRMELRAKKDKKEFIVKMILNSLYGKLFQCIENYEEVGEEVKFTGFEAGGFFNPVLASIVTAFSRLRLVEAQKEIEKRGGKAIIQMTDALYWEGTTSQLPKRFKSILSHYKGLEENGWSDNKEIGFFDIPKELEEGLFLRTGFYEYKDKETGEFEVKTMGFFLEETPTDSILRKKLEYALMQNADTWAPKHHKYIDDSGYEFIYMNSSAVVTPANLSEKDENGDYKIKGTELLGRIVKKELKQQFGRIAPKRVINPNAIEGLALPTFTELLNGLIPTEPFDVTALSGDNITFEDYSWAMEDGYIFDPLDGRLLSFRKLTEGKQIITTKEQKTKKEKERKQENNKAQNDKYDTLIKQLAGIVSIGKKKARQMGVRKLRELLIENGIEPLC